MAEHGKTKTIEALKRKEQELENANKKNSRLAKVQSRPSTKIACRNEATIHSSSYGYWYHESAFVLMLILMFMFMFMFMFVHVFGFLVVFVFGFYFLLINTCQFFCADPIHCWIHVSISSYKWVFIPPPSIFHSSILSFSFWVVALFGSLHYPLSKLSHYCSL